MDWNGPFFFVSVDIDECSNSNFCGDENATCQNTVGSYECICKKDGYEYDRANKSCVDIDECEKGPGCGKNAICKNNDGDFSCLCQPDQRLKGNDCEGGCFILFLFNQ